jgi:hypothetical protein
MGKLTNQVAVVTGASKGIGAGIVKALAAEGASVVVNHRRARFLSLSCSPFVNGIGGLRSPFLLHLMGTLGNFVVDRFYFLGKVKIMRVF